VSVEISEWLNLLEREYLQDFVKVGGAGVKFAVIPDEELAGQVKREVRERAEASGYLVAELDASRVKVHLMHQAFHEIARQVPWTKLAEGVVRRCYAEMGLEVEQGASIDAIAQRFGREPRFLRAELHRELEALLGRSHELTRDFRYAMVWMCADQAAHDGGTAYTSPLLDWLKGELRLISALKKLGIFQKIGRHNARAMLASLSAWSRLAGFTGLVVLWDIRQLAIARRADAGQGQHYSTAAVMDGYEVLRQLIDATDDLTGMLSLVIAQPELLDDDRRGVKVYKALYERIWPDVRLRHHDNPLSALATLGQKVGVR